MSISRDATRFLTDVATRPLSTTVSRYDRLHLSRRRGNAIRRDLLAADFIAPVTIATRSGQVVLYELTAPGRRACESRGIDPGRPHRPGLEHRYWARKVAQRFADDGYETSFEHALNGGGAVDILAERPGERIAIEIETGKSDIKKNVEKLRGAGFDRIVFVATSPSAVAACQLALTTCKAESAELMTWLDVV